MDIPIFKDPTTHKIAEFLNGIGIGVRAGDIPEQTFLPGIRIESEGMVVDESRLPYPGDLLHEAGHIACMPAERRKETFINAGHDPAEEMMAIAWSWAAAVHIGIPPEILFHPDGYRGGSQSLIDNFSDGKYIAVPMLQWVGLSTEPQRAEELGVPPYPHMIRWIRE